MLFGFLDSQNIKYVAISHSRAYTAQGSRRSLTYSGKELAKTVIMRRIFARAFSRNPHRNIHSCLMRSQTSYF
jgi:hypothetical protein